VREDTKRLDGIRGFSRSAETHKTGKSLQAKDIQINEARLTWQRKKNTDIHILGEIKRVGKRRRKRERQCRK